MQGIVLNADLFDFTEFRDDLAKMEVNLEMNKSLQPFADHSKDEAFLKMAKATEWVNSKWMEKIKRCVDKISGSKKVRVKPGCEAQMAEYVEELKTAGAANGLPKERIAALNIVIGQLRARAKASPTRNWVPYAAGTGIVLVLGAVLYRKLKKD